MPRSGGRSELERWLEGHRLNLKRYAIARLGDESLAEDLVQDTVLAALKGAEQFKGQSSIQTWLIGILRHKILDHLRGQFRKRAEISISESDPEDDLFDARGRWVHPPVAWQGDPYDAVREAEFRQVLAGCLERVPPDKRAVLLLRIDGMPSDEICKQLAITPTNLWVIMHRVRAMMRRCLEDKWFAKK